MQKVKHVSNSDDINIFNEKFTLRGSKNKETQLALRQGLDFMSAGNKKKKKGQEAKDQEEKDQGAP